MSLENTQRALGEISIESPTDDDGYLGRQCPDEVCKKYFKLTPGTGLTDPDEHYCPYCGTAEDPDSFHTDAQVEYAKSLAFRKVSDAMYEDLKSMEFTADRGLFELSLTVDRGSPPALRTYDEKELETEVKCNCCDLQYAVYGVFAYCPDCGRYNSLEILKMNFEIVERLLELAEAEREAEVQEALFEEALKKCVSASDAWGRALTARFHDQSVKVPERGISFQNIERAREQIVNQFDYDIAAPIGEESFQLVHCLFQKRHVLEHNMGEIDESYLKRTGVSQTELGRRVSVSKDEVRKLLDELEPLAEGLVRHLEEFFRDGPDRSQE